MFAPPLARRLARGVHQQQVLIPNLLPMVLEPQRLRA
jgi:hypothetical protein